MADGLQDVDVSLVDSLVVPVSLHDVYGRFVHMNAAAERAIGFSNDQMRGRHFTDTIPPEARENVEALFRHAVEHGEPTDFETVFEDAGGHRRGTRAQHLPLRRGDTIVGVLILAFDAHLQPSDPVYFEQGPRLTGRQRETLSLLAAGLSTAEVARRLNLSPETIRNHLRNASRELNAHTRLEAIAAAQRLGLLAAPALGPQPDDGNRP
jgi:PAS domain S-box-containing protein